ncbi:MAG: hypothetical protein DJ555_01880 [Desulfurococcaceae archaeon]|nr:MAG: hypothetical protein DJ555_01880 [Desulfurococcaceae archaeon]
MEQQPYGFRVRGIYATAISKILIDYGFKPGDISEKLSRRLNTESEGPVDVTVKNSDDNKSLLVIVGVPGAVEEAFKAISGVVKASLYRGPLPLYMVFRAKVSSQDMGGCYVETPLGVHGYLKDRICYKGEDLVATIIGYRGDGTPLIDRGIYIVGRYMILLDKPVEKISEHIRDPDVILELRGISDMILKQGLGVSWRSSASRASLKELLEELDALKRTLTEVSTKASSAASIEPLYVGEKIAFIHLSPEDMYELDRVRSFVTPTAPMHHVIKAFSDNPDTADLLDSIAASGAPPNAILNGLRRHLVERLSSGAEILIIHNRPFEKPRILGKGRLKTYLNLEDGLWLGVVRSITGSGVYDGLGIQKEKDDRALTIIGENSWLTIHAYYRYNSELKGVYININTKPAVIYDGMIKISYLDLELDASIVRGELKIVDQERFERLCGGNETGACGRAGRELERVKNLYSDLWFILSRSGEYVTSGRDEESMEVFNERFRELVSIIRPTG